MKIGRSTVAAAALAIGLASAVTLWNTHRSIAQTAPSEATSRPAAQISADAAPLLQQVSDAYRNLNSLQLAGTVAMEFDGGGQKKSEHAELSGSWLLPNQLRHELKGADVIDSDGKKLTAYVNAKNTYLQYDAPKTRDDGLPMQIGDVIMDQNPSLLLALVPDAGKVLSSGATAISKSADVTIDGKNFPTLNIVSVDQDTQVSIDPNSHLVRRMSHDLRKMYQSRGVPDLKFATVTVDYTQTTPNAGAAATGDAFAKQFAWTPPADAKPMSADPMAGIDETAMQMQGKKAPAFSLKDLNGKTVSLADLKGKVVVLDFWATFCMPCRLGLPFVDKVAKERAADATVLAIDFNEDEPTARTGQKEMSLSLPILLDNDGKVGEAYGADHGIPETVVIGKNGIIRKVMLGLNPDNPSEEQTTLNAEIDAANKGG